MGTSILINKSLGRYINTVLLWWHWFRRCPCLFVAWVQLSQICVALPGCLDICQTQLCPAVSKGGSNVAWFARNFGLRMCWKKICSPTIGWYTIRSYLFICPSGKQACHLRFEQSLPAKLEKNRILYFQLYLSLMLFFIHSNNMYGVTQQPNTSFWIQSLRVITSYYAVSSPCFLYFLTYL